MLKYFMNRYLVELLWEEAFRLMGPTFKLMRWDNLFLCDWGLCSWLGNIGWFNNSIPIQMFADHDSSLKPIDVPRAWLWNLPRRTVYFGTSVPTIFRGSYCKPWYGINFLPLTKEKNLTLTLKFMSPGLTTQEIQQCFWRGMYKTWIPIRHDNLATLIWDLLLLSYWPKNII